MSRVEGTCDPRFAAVRDVFAEQLANPDEIGAAVAITLEGERVVDLWGGHADAKRTRAWTPDTIANLFSTTKGMTALCAHRLADQGKLDLDAPVARYWPEFAQADKGAIPVRWLLDHSAGLVAIEKPMPPAALYDWDAMAGAYAEQKPWWEPGTEHGYHALSFGWLVGELIRRTSGRSVGTYFRDEIAGPLGADLWIGTPAELDPRIAEIEAEMPKPGDPLLAAMLANAKPYTLKAFMNPPPGPEGLNSRQWRGAEIPAGNAHGSARALARIYGGVARGGEQDGIHLLSPAAIDRARTEQRHGVDNVLPGGLVSRFGLGFQLGTEAEPIGPNGGAFGHPGAGGSFGFADPEARLGFGYVMNRMETGLFLIGRRATALMNAAFASLG